MGAKNDDDGRWLLMQNARDLEKRTERERERERERKLEGKTEGEGVRAKATDSGQGVVYDVSGFGFEFGLGQYPSCFVPTSQQNVCSQIVDCRGSPVCMQGCMSLFR